MMSIIFKKTPIPYLVMNNLFKILFLLFLTSCSSETSQYDKLENFLSEELDFSDLDDYNAVVVINEMGDCINCNDSFSKMMTKHLKNKRFLYIISTSGTKVDVSGYLNSDTDNILFDFRNNFKNLNLLEKSAIIMIENNKIDTIIQIDKDNLNDEVERFI